MFSSNPKFLYHPRQFNFLKEIILVVVVGGSDVKMGCTILEKFSPLEMSEVYTYLSVVVIVLNFTCVTM